MTIASSDANHDPAHDARLVEYHTGGGCTAWRLTEHDAPGYFAYITDDSGASIPSDPEHDMLLIGVYTFDGGDHVELIQTLGRTGLNEWYLEHVGHEPDKEPEGPRQLTELIADVASHLLLRQTALPLYKLAFPDFGDLDIELPAGFADVSYMNDTCPSFASESMADGSKLVLYVDYKNSSMRECAGGQRFALHLLDHDQEFVKVVVLSDHYDDVLKEIKSRLP